MGQPSTTPFMNIWDGYNSKKVVTCDTQDRLDSKLDKITFMISKLTAWGSNQNRPFKPKIYQAKREDKPEIIMNKVNIKIDQIVEIGECHLELELIMDRIRGRSQYDHNYRSDFRRGNFRGMQNYGGQNFRGGYKGNYQNEDFGRGRSRSRERVFK